MAPEAYSAFLFKGIQSIVFMLSEIPKEMHSKAKEIASELRKRNDFVVVHHIDADGISAGAIAFKMLEREKKKVKAIGVKQLYKETISEIKGMGKNYIFVDFGSGQLSELKKNFCEARTAESSSRPPPGVTGDFFVFDHHQIEANTEHNFQFNPMLFGINGGTELSGSGTAYFIALALNEKNIDLSVLALIGAAGDMQDFKGKLIGLNELILEHAIKEKLIEKKTDLRLYGRISRPLIQFIMFSSNPILPELTANELNTIEFLKKTGIQLKNRNEWRAYEDLNLNEKKELSTALMMHLMNQGAQEWKLKELIGEIYTLLKEEKKSVTRDVKEFSTMLNACGRHGKPEIGLKVCLGDRKEFFDKAMDLMLIHKKELSEGIRFVQEKGIQEMEEFYFFDAGKEISETIVGIVAGMLYGSGIIEAVKPILAFSRTEKNEIKCSGRGTTELVRKGLNLGKAMKEVCAKLGEDAEGGGHKIAAGSKFPEEKKEEFLKLINEEIRKQMSSYT
ncbi:MAG: DHH family phosphoesterase [Candidatus Diapherotrites archaeon]